MILKADKGVSMVVMDRDDYIRRLSHYYNNQQTDPSPMIPPISINQTYCSVKVNQN